VPSLLYGILTDAPPIPRGSWMSQPPTPPGSPGQPVPQPRLGLDAAAGGIPRLDAATMDHRCGCPSRLVAATMDHRSGGEGPPYPPVGRVDDIFIQRSDVWL
jgi:hypothetical protein